MPKFVLKYKELSHTLIISTETADNRCLSNQLWTPLTGRRSRAMGPMF